jgi:uncharacterized membrane protein (UPF0127 family)
MLNLPQPQSSPTRRRVRPIGAALALVIITLVSIASPIAAQADPVTPPWRFDFRWASERADILVGDTSLRVEIADTPFLRSRGLSYRDGLRPGTGMLFVFGEPAIHDFWMKGMRFCLDIVWIEDGQIVGAAQNACPEPGVSDEDLTRYESPSPVSYVLEVPAGWLTAHGYSTGTPVDIERANGAT